MLVIKFIEDGYGLPWKVFKQETFSTLGVTRETLLSAFVSKDDAQDYLEHLHNEIAFNDYPDGST